MYSTNNMNELQKRFTSGLWVAFGGFVTVVITLTLEHIEVFNLSETEKTMALILGTAIVTQITKYLNTK